MLVLWFIKGFLENLDPFPDMLTNDPNEQIEKYLFDTSLEIEPKNAKPKVSQKYKYSQSHSVSWTSV